MTSNVHPGRSSVLLLTLLVISGTSPADGVPPGLVEFVAINVDPTRLYAGPGTIGPDGEWHIEEAPASGGVVSPFDPDNNPYWFINPFGQTTTTLDWTGNSLASDTSAGGDASASFNGCGTLTITGELTDENLTPVFTGVLLTGQVSAFSVQEPQTPNYIDQLVRPIFMPTGGVLADGTLGPGALQLSGPYSVSFTAFQTMQNGGALVDFQSDIAAIEGYELVLSGEPPSGECSGASYSCADRNGDGITDSCAAPSCDVLYVRASAPSGGSGASWGDAYNDLQTALCVAWSGRTSDSVVREIWVAEGVYKPAPPGGPRTHSFRLPNGLSLFGGFAGFEALREERDVAANVTILSGDLADNDEPLTPGAAPPASWSDNAYHVVKIFDYEYVTGSIDGFTISGGNANSGLGDRGGGVYISFDAFPSGSPKIANCKIAGNAAITGGGLYLGSGSCAGQAVRLVSNCDFVGNIATGDKGSAVAVASESNQTEFLNCLFENNTTLYSSGSVGGAVSVTGTAQTSISGCRFVRNVSMGAPNGAGGAVAGSGRPRAGRELSFLWQLLCLAGRRDEHPCRRAS